MATVYAARYDMSEPTAERQFSSAGWMLSEDTADRARSEWRTLAAGCDCGECRACRTAAEAFEDNYRIAERDGRFFVERFGLSAFVGNDEEEAIEAAQEDDRFADMPLWVFVADIVSEEDEDAGVYGNIARVMVRGAARRVN